MHVCIEDADCDMSDVACDRSSKGESTHVVVYRILTPFKRHCGTKTIINKDYTQNYSMKYQLPGRSCFDSETCWEEPKSLFEDT
jgi:hypothetical protein